MSRRFTHRVTFRSQFNPDFLILSVGTSLEDPTFLEITSSTEGGAVVGFEAYEREEVWEGRLA